MSPRRLDLVNDGQRGRLVEIGGDDLHAFLGKPDRCGAADAPRRRSGYDRDLVLKSPHRCRLVSTRGGRGRRLGGSGFSRFGVRGIGHLRGGIDVLEDGCLLEERHDDLSRGWTTCETIP